MHWITWKQAEVINVIVNYIRIYKKFPSLRKIWIAVWWCSKQAISSRIKWLMNKWLIMNIDWKYAPTKEWIDIMIKTLTKLNK